MTCHLETRLGQIALQLLVVSVCAFSCNAHAGESSRAVGQVDEDSQTSFPSQDWTHAEPAAHGFSQAGINQAVAYAKQEGSTSGMIVHDGVVLAEWGDVARKSNLHSARKSLMSALIGIAVERGQIHMDDTLEQLGVDDNPPALSVTERQATVRMLLEARSGVYHPTVYETAGMLAHKPVRYSHLPGTFWYYNNWDFNTVGALYENATGQSIFNALQREIAGPIGMQDYSPSDGRYIRDGAVTKYPAYPLDMSARDLARFALLYLHNGRWHDKQIIPGEWVAESTRSYSNTATGGYGYMWWTSVPATRQRSSTAILLRPTFWADGYLGQYAVVVPSLNLVVVSLVDSRLTSKRMGQSKMERLMWLTEAAQNASGIGPDPLMAEGR
ncbi:beta-lactamase family protein [Ralstonia sp. CHL-2022]|uniref:Beta-lactamase family protein n=1 Tax=Ralstonia mojiangensis TaxID=2953895 RepID=A0AAE3LEH9_9RALS|nr:serine hydrolase [Ralstonia mojiangensis]MCT7317421.1 beta-lactamase family protein [Ralstonia mojiangensis]